jgi:DNA-binding LytR/AlgR family response regulator
MNQLFKCIIVEDEELLAGVLKSYLEHFEQLELVAICKHPLEAHEVLKKMSIDLMFLDIEMPHISGIDFLKTLPHPPSVIFTTAYSEYAVKGFDHNAVDYLLKPIKLSRFLTAVNKFLDRQQLHEPEMNSSIKEDTNNILNIKSDGRFIRLKQEEITYIEGLREYVRYHLKNGEKYIVLQSLVKIEEDFPS